MVNRFMNMAFGAIVGQMLKHKIREGSIKAVKGYIEVVKYARLGVLGLFGLGAVAALLISGIVLMVIGVVGLLPIEATTAAIVLLVVGALLTLLVGVGLYMAFQQSRWLEVSRSYELMDTVLAPWPGVLPPNPMEVVKGNLHVPPAPSRQELREAREAELRAQEMARKPMAAPIA
jgi:hypothetical protein